MSKVSYSEAPTEAASSSINDAEVLFVPSSSKYVKYNRQFFAAIVACLSAFSMGTVVGFTSPAMATLQPDFALNEEEVSFVTSIINIGALPAGFVGGTFVDYFGRKLAIMFNCSVFAIGWVLIICANNVSMLYVGRFITGFGRAMASLSMAVYLTEIASPEIRGILGSFIQLSGCIGILYSYTLGMYFSWHILTLASIAVPAVQILLMLLLPETPTWLARHDYDEEATAALVWLRRSTAEFDEKTRSKVQVRSDEDKVTLKSFMEPTLLKPLGIMFTLMFIQNFCGVGVIILYAADIFKSTTDAINPNVSAIIIASSMLIACCVASVLVDKLGRRILLVVSGIFMAVGMISLGSFYYAKAADDSSVDNVVWLPIVSLVVCEFAYGIGFGPVPWLMMGELVPNRARGMASGIITTFGWTAAFTMAKAFVNMRHTMKNYGVFWMFSAVCIFAVVFSFFVVPETKGKTFEEIEQHFKGSKKREINDKM